MRVNLNPSQNYYKNQNSYRPAVNTLAFRGEVGDEFVKGIKDGSLADSEDIKNLMSNVSRMGFVPESQAKDILESAVRYSKDLWQRKLDLDKRWDDITEAEEVMAVEVVNHSKAKYNINTEEYIYENYGEQLAVVTKLLNSLNKKLIKSTPTTPKDIVEALRNNDGTISDADLKILQKVIEAREKCNAPSLLEAIKSVKDEDGNFDLEKTAAFIAYSCYYPGNEEDLSSAIDFVKNNCNPVQQVGFELNEDLYNRMETFINQINESTDMKDLIKSLGLKKMGMVPASKIRDILSMIAEFNKEHNRKAKYNVIRAANVSDQDENIAKAESLVRTIYNIEDPEVTTYNTLPEQMLVLGKFIYENKEKFDQIMPETEELAKAMQNDKGIITNKDLDLLKRILDFGKGKCNIYVLSRVFTQVKDMPEEELEYLGKVIEMCGLCSKNLPLAIMNIKYGSKNINLEKEAAFINHHNGYNTSSDFLDSIDFVERNCYSMPYERMKNSAYAESAIRAINGTEDSEVKTYLTLGEQMMAVSKLLKGNDKKLRQRSKTTTEDIVKSMQNNKGEISSDMIDFAAKIIEMREYTPATLLQAAILLVKDENGNLDFDKKTAFIASYAWNNATLSSVIEQMKETYYSKASQTQNSTVTAVDANIEKFTKIDDAQKQKVNEIVKIINSKPGNKIIATVRKDGKIRIEAKDRYFTFRPELLGLDSDEAFELIGEIISDVSFGNCKNLTSLGGVELIDGAVYCFGNIPHFDRSIVKDQIRIYE